MRISKIILTNWLCYRGTFDLDLDDTAYAIVARSTDNEERSNWLGKTSLIESIGFALYGVHRKRTADEWINNNESFGAVQLEFDDGTIVRRERHRGKKTVLTCRHVLDGAAAESTQDEAQRRIVELTGVDEADFFASTCIQQRQIARLILARPETRMEIVSAWLRLEPLQAADALVRTRLSAALAQLAASRARLDETAAQLATRDREDVLDRRVYALDESSAAAKRLSAAKDRVVGNVEAVNRIAVAREVVARRNALVADGQTVAEEIARLRSYIATLPEGGEASALRAKTSALEVRCNELASTRRSLDLVAGGKFDGRCPVVDFECPARFEIDMQRSNAEKKSAAIAAELTDLDRSARDARATEERATQIRARLARLEGRIHSLRNDVQFLIPRYKEAKALLAQSDADAVTAEYRSADDEFSAATRDVREASALLEAADRDLAYIDKLNASKSEHEEVIRKTQSEVDLLRAAGVVFGRTGAQRMVAEQSLGAIQVLANDMLSAAGINLSLSVSWQREGKDPAKACDVCGAAFPASAKIKVCGACGAARGLQTSDKLEILLSDQSGAAEDLAGLTFQLAASAWLRAQRGGKLSLAILDEPFGQLDKANRRALSAAIPKMLAAAGIQQAFVIAHSPDALDALPSRISIENNDGSAVPRIQ